MSKNVFKIPFKNIIAGVAVLLMLQGPQVSAADATTSGDQSSAATASAISSDGYSDDAAKLKTETSAFLSHAVALESAGGKVPVMELLKKIDSFASYYSNLHGTCTTSQASAKFICREETSPKLQDTLNQVNTLMGAVTASGVTDACSTFGKIMTIAQAGLTAYTAACSAARAACESSCSTVYTNIKNINDLSKSLMNTEDICFSGYPPSATTPEAQAAAKAKTTTMCLNLANELNGAFKAQVALVAEKENNYNDASPSKSIISKNKACTYTYASMVISAGTGILGVIQSAKAANKCEDETDGTAATTTTTTTTETCSIAANANLPECICAANPRLAGCANALEKAGDATTSTVSALSSPNAASTTSSGLTSADLASEGTTATTAGTSSDSSGSSGTGAPVGGASGLSSGGGGSSAGTGAGTDGTTKSALNANILGGGTSGGGGGSWGAGRSAASGDSKYRSYLPGGDKDPNKLAGQSTWTKEVTSQGGKSNWEKVRDRYRDNSNTLIGN